MENEVQAVEEVAGLTNGNIIKVAAVVLGIGAIIGIGFGIKKLVDRKKEIKLNCENVEQLPENEVQ
jgi:hypothetical protein